MKIKKLIAVVLGITIPAGAIVGGVNGYKSYQDKKLIAEVQPVSNINWGYWGDTETSYGMVTNDSSQEIYLSDSKKIKKIYVSQGDTVSKGDPLIEYDTSELNIEIERKKLDISNVENNIAIANHVLDQLKVAKPVDKTVPKLDTAKLEQYRLEDEKNKLPERDAKDNRIYNYVTENSLPYNMKTDPATGELVYPAGTEAEPYIYYCNQGAYVYGSFFNWIRPTSAGNDGKYVKFIICRKDADGKMVMTTDANGQEPNGGGSQDTTESTESTESTEGIESTEGTEKIENTESTEKTDNTEKPSGKDKAAVTNQETQTPAIDNSVSPNTAVFNGNNIPASYDSELTWSVFTGEEYVPKSLADEYMDKFLDFATDWELPDGYTTEELVKEAASKEAELKSLDIQKRRLELQLQTLLNTAADGIVYATVDGVAKTVGDPDEFSGDGTAFLVVTGDDGLYVSGTISELLLGDISVGTVVTANSWESGMTFEATVTEISDYPSNGNSNGDGNPNVSYYNYTAYIEDSSALKNGEYVDLSISTNQSETGGLFIEKAYVRSEDGKPYVLIADENDRLKKQYVVTGRTVYGSAIEIKSGLTEEDRIAFPYGKNAVEGVAVTEPSNIYY